jgi:hypothetical protein
LNDINGNKVHGFSKLASPGVGHFKEIFREPDEVKIGEILKLISFFPRLIEEEDNLALYSVVTKDELIVVISSFKRDKNPGPDNWMAEFFEYFFDVLGDDLLQVVEEVCSGIPNCLMDYPSTFDDFRPISLCNSLYKIIAKVIAVRLKPVLAKVISPKQFGFLKGRLIHEAIGTELRKDYTPSKLLGSQQW